MLRIVGQGNGLWAGRSEKTSLRSCYGRKGLKAEKEAVTHRAG